MVQPLHGGLPFAAQRAALAAREKRARRDWEAKREKEIREETARALEPEVQRIIDRQKTEIAKLREGYERSLEEAKAELAAGHAEEMGRVKRSVEAQVAERMVPEREDLATRERRMRADFEEELATIRASLDWLMVKVAVEVFRQRLCGPVSPFRFLGHRAENDPVEVTLELAFNLGWLNTPLFGDGFLLIRL